MIHTVGPIYRDGNHGEPEILAACYRRSFELATEIGARLVTFPAISTGVYGYPIRDAASVAVAAVIDQLSRPDCPIEKAVFVLFGLEAREAFEAAASALLGDGPMW